MVFGVDGAALGFDVALVGTRLRGFGAEYWASGVRVRVAVGKVVCDSTGNQCGLTYSCHLTRMEASSASGW